jgi:hypothetical protein
VTPPSGDAILERIRLGREMVGSVDALEYFRA